jgi:hypothetical protein
MRLLLKQAEKDRSSRYLKALVQQPGAPVIAALKHLWVAKTSS